MTRKRCIKLLMADGIPRNIAVASCRHVRFIGATYEDWYACWREVLESGAAK